jgi:hypothetical protein
MSYAIFAAGVVLKAEIISSFIVALAGGFGES